MNFAKNLTSTLGAKQWGASSTDPTLRSDVSSESTTASRKKVVTRGAMPHAALSRKSTKGEADLRPLELQVRQLTMDMQAQREHAESRTSKVEACLRSLESRVVGLEKGTPIRKDATGTENMGDLHERVETLERASRPADGTFGKPFAPTDSIYENGGTVTLHLPESLWSAAMVMPLLSAFGWYSPESRCNATWIFIVPQYFALGCSVFVQGVLISWLRSFAEEASEACVEAEDMNLLRYVCMAVLVAAAMDGDIVETLTMARWLQQIPAWDPQLHPQRCEEASAPLALRLATDGEGWTYTTFATGITPWYRVFVFLFILLPKLMLASAVLIFAAGHVTRSGSAEDLFMNSLAALFVLDVDNVLYRALNPILVKRMMNDFPHISVPAYHATYGDVAWEYIGFWPLAVLIAGLAISLSSMWCIDSWGVTVAAILLPAFLMAGTFGVCCCIGLREEYQTEAPVEHLLKARSGVSMQE